MEGRRIIGRCLPELVLSAAIIGCAVYANLHPNRNNSLGAEYFNIAKALVAGEGFANPFGDRTGPTAWMPPMLPCILAALLWAADGNRVVVTEAVVFLQVGVLISTGLLVLTLSRQTTRRLWTWVVALAFFVALLAHFQLCFQVTHDGWLVLLSINVLIAGLCWFEPLQSWKPATLWGVAGGMCALINPIVWFAWGVLTILSAVADWQSAPRPRWSPVVVTMLCAVLTLTPWTIHNYLVFGRWIPIKSNLAYELYQSQCLQADGMIQTSTFRQHPYGSHGEEWKQYRLLGEIAYVEKKREQFWQAVWSDPGDFVARVADRFLGTTLWYDPFNRRAEARQPLTLWLNRVVFPLPFLSLLFLVFSARRYALHKAQWLVMGVYLLYLLPYIVASYYERYGMPLLGTKVLLVVWALERVLAPLSRYSSGRGEPPTPLPEYRKRGV